MSSTSVIVDAVRSPMGVKKGRMIGMRADDLAAQVVEALFERNPACRRTKWRMWCSGCAFPEHTQGMLMARGVALLAGLPEEAGGKVVNRFCGSSMDAVHQLSQAILAGDLQCGIAVGVEDMFAIPMGGFNPSFHPKLLRDGVLHRAWERPRRSWPRSWTSPASEQEEFAVRIARQGARRPGRKAGSPTRSCRSRNGDVTIDKDEGPTGAGRGKDTLARAGLHGGRHDHRGDLQPDLDRRRGADRLQ